MSTVYATATVCETVTDGAQSGCVDPLCPTEFSVPDMLKTTVTAMYALLMENHARKTVEQKPRKVSDTPILAFEAIPTVQEVPEKQDPKEQSLNRAVSVSLHHALPVTDRVESSKERSV